MARTFGPKLNDTLMGPWEVVRQSLVDELSGFRVAFEKWVGSIFDSDNRLNATAFQGDSSVNTVYISNEGSKHSPKWAKVHLVNGVKSRLQFDHLVEAPSASVLVGRGSAALGGDYQVISLGDGLEMDGTTLKASSGQFMPVFVGPLAVTLGDNLVTVSWNPPGS